MVDLSGLLSEFSPDNPCGENLEYDNARVALDNDIQGTPENQFSGEKALPPNWREVNKQAIALLQKSRDLQVILYLIRSLIPLEGICGFRDGLQYLEEALNRYWDSIHPQLDADDGFDPTMRINILEELINFDWILRPLSLAMLVESKAVGRFNLRDIQYATDKIDPPAGVEKPDVSAIKAAFLDVDSEALNASYQAVIDSIRSVDELDAFAGEKVGVGQGANLSALKTLLKDILYQYEQFGGSRLAGEAELEQTELEGGNTEIVGGSGSVKAKSISGAIESRQDVLRALEMLCKYYAENEPSSPVPILLKRAKYLVTADFIEVIQNLLPDALSQLDAIKGPDPD
ncbi:MAG: type VI secretion protein [Proteobacteria bacterium ST_bin11]|nr:MAG: type VI secretion protein [Proteobacteria bacterium ST_bin11]